MKRTYSVTMIVTESHTYEVEGNTPEEAESTAEQYYEGGELGAVVKLGVESTDVIPVTEGTMGEIVPDLEAA